MPLPGSLSLVQVTGPIVDDQGNGLNGTLEFSSSINRVLSVGGLVAPITRRVAVTNGAFSYGFLPSSVVDMQPKAWTWHVRFTSSDQSISFEFDVLIPSSGPVTLGSIASVPSTGQVIVTGTGSSAGAVVVAESGTFLTMTVSNTGSNVSVTDNGTYLTMTVN